MTDSDTPVVSETETESTTTTGEETQAAGVCPVIHGEGQQPHPTNGSANENWWPNRLNLKVLAKNPAVANPLGGDFDYATAFAHPRPAHGQDRDRAGADHVAAVVAG